MITKSNLCFTLLVFFCAIGGTQAEEAKTASWLQWRGPSRDGHVKGEMWPDSLDEERLKQTWSVKLGPSYSGPIVAGNRVFVTETVDRKFEVVRALDRATGKLLWEARWQGSISVPFFAKSNGDWIRATPACDGERLFVAGIRDVLVCLDCETGKEVWRIDFVTELKSKLPSFGFVSSPLVIGDHVFVQAGGGFVKLDKRTGKIVWHVAKDGGGMFGSAFSSPYATVIHGENQIIVQTRKSLTGVDPESGKVLWSRDIPAFRGMNILTPTVVENSIFTSSYGGGSMMLTTTKDDQQWKVDETWKHKSQAYMSSPVVIDGHLYLHLRNQRFTCINLADGKDRWTTTPFGKYWSMVANGDRILALDERGELLLIRANPEKFELLDRRKVAENSWAHLAVCGNEVFVRELNAMTVYRWK